MGIRCVCDLRVQEARPSEADEQKEVGRRQVLKSSDLESGPGWSVTLTETPDVQMLALHWPHCSFRHKDGTLQEGCEHLH